MLYESENNNLRENANSYTLGEVMRGKISADGDVDCYKVYLRPGHVVFSFTVPQGKNYRIRVFKEGVTATVLTENVDSSTSYTDRTCEADVAIGEAAYYYICISYNPTNTTFSDTEEYTLCAEYTYLNMPVNINQHAFDGMSYQCAAVCAIDVSNYYRNEVYPQNTDALKTAIEDELSYMSEEGCYTANGVDWSKVPNVTMGIAYKDGNVADTTVYAKAVEQIKIGKPLLIHYYISGKSRQHWVVAVGYQNTNGSLGTLIVYDPSVRSSTAPVNTPWTFAESKGYNFYSVPSTETVYYGYVTTAPST